MNIKIKQFGENLIPATTKFQLLDPDSQHDGITAREKGYRPLEPGEVVEIEDSFGKELLSTNGVSGFIEITTEEPTRPLFFGDIDAAEGVGLARATSQRFAADTPEKEAEKEVAKEKVKTGMKKKPRKNAANTE